MTLKVVSEYHVRPTMLGISLVIIVPHLATRREYLRIVTLHKIVTGQFSFLSDILATVTTRYTQNTTVTTNSFIVPFAHTLSYKSSFIPGTVHA